MEVTHGSSPQNTLEPIELFNNQLLVMKELVVAKGSGLKRFIIFMASKEWTTFRSNPFQYGQHSLIHILNGWVGE